MRRGKIRRGHVSLRYTCYWNAEGVYHEIVYNKNLIIKKEIHPYGTVESEETRQLTEFNKDKAIRKIERVMKKYPGVDSVDEYRVETPEGTFEIELMGHRYLGSESSRTYIHLEKIFSNLFKKASLIRE